MTLQNNPYEVGLGWLVDLDRGNEFIGKAALVRIKADGVKRRLVGIEIGGERVEFNTTRWPILLDGDPIGQATSVIYSPRLGKNIGYGMVPIEYAESGTQLTVLLEGLEARSAVVVRKPFIDPSKTIPKS